MQYGETPSSCKHHLLLLIRNIPRASLRMEIVMFSPLIYSVLSVEIFRELSDWFDYKPGQLLRRRHCDTSNNIPTPP